MKKVAIVLCVLMLVGTSLPLVQADPEPTNNPIVTVDGGWGVVIDINRINEETPIIIDTKGVILPGFNNIEFDDYSRIVIHGLFLPIFSIYLQIGNDYFFEIAGRGILFLTYNLHIKE